jgi:hypothetical protein
MNEEPKDKPRSRLNSLIAGGEAKKPADEKNPLLSRLPRKTDVSPPVVRGPENKPPPTPPKPAPVKRKVRYNFGPPFWTITGTISLVVNLVLIVILLGLLQNLRNLQVQNVMGLGNNLLGGLYTNFEKMDRAHIRTTIPVVTEIPVKFDLLLNQQTSVVLSQDVTIDNVLVTVQTGGLNISRARSTIVLPQGTNLPVFLNLTVPVDTKVPVTLSVNVDIPMNQTELHEPFVGLQEVVKPFYCLVSPSALNLDGQTVCR